MFLLFIQFSETSNLDGITNGLLSAATEATINEDQSSDNLNSIADTLQRVMNCSKSETVCGNDFDSNPLQLCVILDRTFPFKYVYSAN